jgi:hypothetical protein
MDKSAFLENEFPGHAVRMTSHVWNIEPRIAVFEEQPDNTLYIEAINAGAGLSGHVILERIQKFAVEFGFSSVLMNDSAYVNWHGKRIPLSPLMIMGLHRTYYGTYGYSNSYEWAYIENWKNVENVKLKNVQRRILTGDGFTERLIHVYGGDSLGDIGHELYRTVRSNDAYDPDVHALYLVLCRIMNYYSGNWNKLVYKRLNEDVPIDTIETET